MSRVVTTAIAFLAVFAVFLNASRAEESAAAKSKPTVYSKWKESDPHGKDIENAYAKKFTIVELRDTKGYSKPIIREYANPQPVLSESGQELKGNVIVCVIATSDGRVIEPFILESTDKRLNMPALDAAKQVRFAPARLNGSPISEVGFLIFGKPLAIVAPIPTYPKGPGPRPEGSGVVLVELDKTTGRVMSAKMEKSTGSKILDDAALTAFSRWRFKPGMVFNKIRIPVTFSRRIRSSR